ncbi:hypothetical protein GCM10009127_11110 [Alteraurantiacibacter aestuarii]|uniref:GDT1 family protein n=1 Tax=Alteraurantiacibacter aestuarii TaxID=650004 RepID=A0A844ZPC9_9SPHN|nr:hypothetical protein [Alteraurantiacibacter aestuarii]MXO87499.1 hypothetical protein [Alteraurantiacibacter aestuarii]
MPALFLCLLACALVTIAGRDQLRVARLSARLGPGAGLFAAIWLSAIATCALAAWIGTQLAAMMTGDAKLMFVALAVLLAALELFVLRAGKAPRQPTRSTGAILLVLLAVQATDAARFLVLSLSIMTGEWVLAAIGGALGSGIALSAAAMAGAEWEARVPLRLLANITGGILLLAALLIGMTARGIIF